MKEEEEEEEEQKINSYEIRHQSYIKKRASSSVILSDVANSRGGRGGRGGGGGGGGREGPL